MSVPTHTYTPEQIDQLVALVEDLARRYPDPPTEDLDRDADTDDLLHDLHEISRDCADLLRGIRGYV